ncbi:YciI family protein [Parasynechococcus sp.]|uniref:YciI family protein n=1 Tax=Parasynechococcus sp. TaxID=3101203 RepID=UPI0037038741
MAWFVKIETFTAVAASLPVEQRRPILEAHRRWVEDEAAAGRRLRSGYLVDGDQQPGGGGLLIFEASSYIDALAWVEDDPMIRAGLVDWQVQEWIPVSGGGWP